ncbi:MAG: Fur family transcriptional regulator [Candidatus Binatia bacterium]
MKPRRTRQLVAVYEVVRAADDHPTAEEVHARVRRWLPRVSLGTVYRNLQKLAARERLQLVQLADRPARYDGRVEHHAHFLCEQCGALTDLAAKCAAAPPARAALDQAGYAVRTHALTFYGQCPACVAARKTSSPREGNRASVRGA